MIPRLAAFLAVSALFAVAAARGAETPKPPNIVLIFADDLGWRDVGYQSDGKFLTPNIDRLAKEGMAFSSGYAAAANCAPSRACLLSGLYTPRHGLFAVQSTARGPKSMQRLVPIPNTDGLRPEFVTIAESLKAAGYATGHIGKWHLAGKDGALPSEQGFDFTFDSFGSGKLAEGSEGNQKGPPDDPKGVFTLTRKAVEFIEQNKDRPFFCYLAHHAIHTPLQARPETLEKVRESAAAAGVSPHYLACTFDFDASVGMLLEKLKELGLEENTLVIFTSDNGATNASVQEPLRGNKGGYYEGGIRVPLIVRWPGVVKPETTSDVPVISQDFYPTFLAAAGTEPAADLKLDGENLMPVLTGSGGLERKGIFWHFPGYLDRPVIRGRDPDFRTRPVTVMRSGDWKLHLYHEEWQLDGGREKLATNRAVELYNLKLDIGERHDLSGTMVEQRDELLDALLWWMGSAEAKMPAEPNPRYKPGEPKPKRDEKPQP